MFANEFDSVNKELFEPKVTSSPSSNSRRSRHVQDKLNALTPSATYVKYGANDLELTTSNVQLIATPTILEPKSILSKKRKQQMEEPVTLDQPDNLDKILRKINSSIMKNVEKRRGCSFNSQKAAGAMKDNLNFLKTAFRQTSGSLINGECFDNKNSFDLFGHQMNVNQLDTLTTKDDVNTLEMLDTMDFPALPALVPKRRKLNPTDRLNFKRGKNWPKLLIIFN